MFDAIDRSAQRRIAARLRKLSFRLRGDVKPTFRRRLPVARQLEEHDNRALKTQPFDPAKYLDSDEAVAEYLTAILEDHDPALLATALGVRLVAQPATR